MIKKWVELADGFELQDDGFVRFGPLTCQVYYHLDDARLRDRLIDQLGRQLEGAAVEIEQKTYALEVIRREARSWLDGDSASSAQTIIRRAHMRADGALRETTKDTPQFVVPYKCDLCGVGFLAPEVLADHRERCVKEFESEKD